ncbi:flippase [Flagellimonas sediminis]|uniref:Oligosaccharide flippase family protein n=1 Tax=Flagellimonas sediminis TaxID=2696468 RepID=A0A6I5KNW8_9FLAO|nr:flippase [Allomuricauda sediminis]NDV42143.1 oligosaccharide flippase family protein [Allomuricauda sediminis]
MSKFVDQDNWRLISNVGWLFFDKGYGAILTLFVYSWIANYFGKQIFGVWNYLMAFSSIIPAISSFGMNFIIVKLIKERPILRTLTIINAMAIRLLGGLITAALFIIIYVMVGINIERDYLLAVGILFLSQIILNINVFVYDNEAQLQNRDTVLSRNIALTLGSAARILCIQFNLTIIYFALTFILEYAIFLYVSYWISNIKIGSLRIKLNRAVSNELFVKGLPLMLSAMVVILYLKVDQVLIGYFMDNASVGIYSAASRITEMVYAVPVIISSVFFPRIIEIKNRKEQREVMLKKLYGIVTLICFLTSLLIYFFSDNIIELIFGPVYENSSEVLKIYAWSLVFMGWQVSSSKFLLVIERNDLIFIRGLIGLIVNISLNIVLIPEYGLKGAAIATLISYFMASYGSNIFFKDLRPLIILQLTGIFAIIKSSKQA